MPKSQSENDTESKRLVARRACLSCREKKIKCDGEALRLQAHDTGNRSVICSNCRMAGTRCKFVQSMRGGRRKKRSSVATSEKQRPLRPLAPSEAEWLPNGQSKPEDAEPPKPQRTVPAVLQEQTPFTTAPCTTATPASPSFLLRLSFEDPARTRLPSPTLLLVSFADPYRRAPHSNDYFDLHARRARELQLAPPHLPSQPVIYTPPYAGHYGPPMYYSPPGAAPLPGAHLQGSPTPQMGYYYGPHTMPPPPAPALVISALQIPQPLYPPQNDLYSRRLPYSHSLGLSHSSMGLRAPDYRSFDRLSSRLWLNLAPEAKHTPQLPDPMAKQLLSVRKLVLERSSPDPVAYFSAAELENFGLPPWPVLNRVLDVYYEYVQPNQQVLPGKQFFLKRLSLKLDSSIIHAIIANVCLRGDWPFEQNESYWVEKMYQYWDNLNDFGMLLCYTLIRETTVIKTSQKHSVDIRDKIHELIQSNHYLETLLSSTNLNERKRFEIESTIRMVWIYWVGMVVFRLHQGRPYSNIQMMRSNNLFTASKIYGFSNSRLPFPISNECYLKGCTQTRLTWSDLTKGVCEDSVSVIKAALILERSMDSIASSDSKRPQLIEDKEFENFLKTRCHFIKEDVVILNSSFHISTFMVLYLNIMQRCFILRDVLAFDDLMGSGTRQKPFGDDGNDFIPRVKSIALNTLIRPEDISSRIEELDEFSWLCLSELVRNAICVLDLINVYAGILPSAPGKRYSVLFGVTSTDNTCDWFDNPDLITKGETAWLKASDFSVKIAYLLVCVLPSLVVLSMLVEMKSKEDKLEVRIRHSNVLKVLPFKVPPRVSDHFSQEELLRDFERVGEFLRFRFLADRHRGLDPNTILNLEKVRDLLEEVMRNL